ncbi:Ubiquitin-conjugating enzyme subunit [Halocaridina rubra]|uniref:Ubiquitin-conjugating enzyme subunit n=1 Tax=Halocaridina rubra TaxID=373956 RepID=A0AAN8X9V4_HALRR
MAMQPSSSAVRALSLEYRGLQEEPVEGFCVKLVNEDNLFEWEVAIFGPPDTLYQGGYFKVGSITYFDEIRHWRRKTLSRSEDRIKWTGLV